MGSFGENLRREREARGITLEDISRTTKISVRLLQAIEEEALDRLPGGVFNLNFVRQYARQVGLDEERVIGEFRALTAEAEAEVPADNGGIWNEASGPSEEYDWDAERRVRLRNWGALVLAGLAVVALGGYFLLGRRSAPASATVATPQPVAAPETPAPPPPAPSSNPGPGPETAAPPPQAPAAQPPETKVTPPAAQPTATPDPGAVREPNVPVDPNAPVRVELVATGQVWVTALSDGKPAFTTTLLPEQKRTATAQERVRVRVGNAGAVRVVLNGQEQPPIGPAGQPRTVLFTVEGMQVVPPPEKPPAPAPETPAKETP